jgi:ADP-heptose:LPS heptosyltransferase
MNQPFANIGILKRIKQEFLFYYLSTITLRLLNIIDKTHPKPDSILILRIDAIGDFVLFTGCLKSLREIYSNSLITLAVNSEFKNLAETCPYVDKIVVWDPHRWQSNYLYRIKFLNILRTAGFSSAIYPVHSRILGGDYMILWTGAQERIGFDGEHLNVTPKYKTKLDSFYTTLVNSGSLKTEIERNKSLIESLGGNVTTPYQTALWPTPQDYHYVTTFIKDANLTAQQWLAVCPGSRFQGRRWNPDNYAQLIQKIWQKFQIKTIIIGSPQEAGLAEKIATASKIAQPIVAAGKFTLRQLAALLSHSTLFIGNETGPVHIAIAMQTPTICILGGGHFGRYLPYGNPALHRIVYHKMDCFNCNWRCKYNTTICIEQIGFQQVWAEANDLLSRLSAPAKQTSPAFV